MPAEWRVLIADDEPVARRGVRQLLAGFPAFKVVAECRNGAEVLQALDSARPDAIFLDIQMPGIDGFDVIRRRTPERMPAVVFLTAYDTFALKAFEAQAVDYLVKPVTQARFDATMKRLARQLGESKTAPDPRIVVSTSKGVTVVPVRDIDWIEAADNYARIWAGGKSYLLRESLGELEKRVEPHGFARAHRKALVRLAGVRALSSAGGELVAELASGATIEVSRRRRSAFSAAVRRAVGGVVAMVMAAGIIARAQTQVPATPQTAKPVFKAAAIHVLLDVIATDKNGTPVTDLTAADFEIKQQGALQTIADFEHVLIPTIDRKIDLKAPQLPPPDTFTNAPPPPNARSFVFVMWALSPENIIPIKRMMTSYISALQPADEVAIVYGVRSDISQDFTSDQGQLVKAVNNIRAGVGGPPFRDWLFTMHSVLQSLKVSRDRRHIIVFISEGFGVPQPFPKEITEIFDEANQLNIPIYTMDPRGLMAPPLGLQGHLEDQIPNGLQRIRGLQKEKEGLQVIAENTNGRAFINAWDVPASSAALIGENNSYYLLGFYPSPYEIDGKFHEVVVKVKRPGVKIRARQGYSSEAPPDPKAKPLRLVDTLGSGMPGGDLLIHAAAASLGPSERGVSALLSIDVEYPEGARGNDQLNLVWIAIDPDGKIRASGEHAVSADLVGSSPRVAIHDAIDLPKGQLTIRATLASRVTKTSGTVHIPLDVSDLVKTRLEVSPLVLSRSPAPPSRLIEINHGLALAPITPSTDRTFSNTDRLRVLARVFATKGDDFAVELTLTLPTGEQRVVPTTQSPVTGVAGATDFLGGLALRDLAPGQYVFTFSARDTARKDDPVQRATVFLVKK